MKLRKFNLVLIVLSIFIIITSSVIVYATTREQVKTVLQEELTKYFEENDTTISKTELQGLLAFYMSSSEGNVNLESSGLSENTKGLIVSRFGPITPSSSTKKANGESCKEDSECSSGKCSAGLFNKIAVFLRITPLNPRCI